MPIYAGLPSILVRYPEEWSHRPFRKQRVVVMPLFNMEGSGMLNMRSLVEDVAWNKSAALSFIFKIANMSPEQRYALPGLPRDVSKKESQGSDWTIRLATLDDVHRIAVVAASGFYWSPVFQYARVHHADSDNALKATIASYEDQFESAINSTGSFIFVAEVDARSKDDEIKEVYARLGKSNFYTAQNASAYQPNSEGRIIVGISEITIPDDKTFDTCRDASAQFLTSKGHCRKIELGNVSKDEDKDREKEARYGKATEESKREILKKNLRLGTLVVHPAYWSQGYAGGLVQWACDYADAFDLELGVSAAPASVSLLKQDKFAFKWKTGIKFDGDENYGHQKEVEQREAPFTREEKTKPFDGKWALEFLMREKKSKR